MSARYLVCGVLFGEYVHLKFPTFETAKTFCKLCSNYFNCSLHVEWINQTKDFIGREIHEYDGIDEGE